MIDAAYRKASHLLSVPIASRMCMTMDRPPLSASNKALTPDEARRKRILGANAPKSDEDQLGDYKIRDERSDS